VLDAGVRALERRDHREDRDAPLVRLHASRREGPAVVDALDPEGDGDVDVAGSEEVAVHRVDVAVLDRGLRGDDALRQDLAAEDPPAGGPVAGPGEDRLARARAGVLESEGAEEVRFAVHTVQSTNGRPDSGAR
jgi:hypothetical protein